MGPRLGGTLHSQISSPPASRCVPLRELVANEPVGLERECWHYFPRHRCGQALFSGDDGFFLGNWLSFERVGLVDSSTGYRPQVST